MSPAIALMLFVKYLDIVLLVNIDKVFVKFSTWKFTFYPSIENECM
jgi:hypothetical protein